MEEVITMTNRPITVSLQDILKLTPPENKQSVKDLILLLSDSDTSKFLDQQGTLHLLQLLEEHLLKLDGDFVLSDGTVERVLAISDIEFQDMLTNATLEANSVYVVTDYVDTNVETAITEMQATITQLQAELAALQATINAPNFIVSGTHNETTGEVVFSNRSGASTMAFNYLQANIAKVFDFDEDTNILTLEINEQYVTVDLSSMIQTIPPATATTLGGVRLVSPESGVWDIRSD